MAGNRPGPREEVTNKGCYDKTGNVPPGGAHQNVIRLIIVDWIDSVCSARPYLQQTERKPGHSQGWMQPNDSLYRVIFVLLITIDRPWLTQQVHHVVVVYLLCRVIWINICWNVTNIYYTKVTFEVLVLQWIYATSYFYPTTWCTVYSTTCILHHLLLAILQIYLNLGLCN